MPNPLRKLAAGAIGLAHQRLALFGVELREEGARFALLLLGGCAAIGLAGLALGFGALALVIGAGPEHRLAAAAALAGAFAAAGAYALWRLGRALDRKPKALAASLAELERDREALAGRSEAARSALAGGAEEILRLVSIGVLAYGIARRLRRGD